MPSFRLSRLVMYARIICVAIWVQLAIWTRPLPRILDIIESKPRKCSKEDDLNAMIRMIHHVSSIKLFVIRKNCLKKGLLTYYFLVISDINQVQINVGIERVNEALGGHCWLTRDGNVYLDTIQNVSNYTIMYSRGV